MSEMFDRSKYHVNDAGIPTIGDDPDREVLEEAVMLEPYDQRTDTSVYVPVRSSWQSACGPAFELGPFTLDSADTARLHNAMIRHFKRFPGEFQPTDDPVWPEPAGGAGG